MGEKLELGFTGRVRLEHFFSFYPNLTVAGQYRFEAITTVRTRLFSCLSLKGSLVDRFLSRPPVATIQKNEVAFTKGMGVNF